MHQKNLIPKSCLQLPCDAETLQNIKSVEEMIKATDEVGMVLLKHMANPKLKGPSGFSAHQEAKGWIKDLQKVIKSRKHP